MKVEDIKLTGTVVELRPMTVADVDKLFDAANFPQLWKWTNNVISTRDDMAKYVGSALADRAADRALPFVTTDVITGEVIGSTRFGNIETAHRKAEIGWTWVTPSRQRSAVNTEAKLLMLKHAFEMWKCVRVELKTDANNERSRNAILRIGAREEGILRNHMITDAGRFRDSVYFSIIESEWPSVLQDLTAKLERNYV